MAGEHEVVGAEAAVPVRVLVGHDADVVGDGAPDRVHVVRVGLVDHLDHLDDAERQEEDVGEVRVPGPHPAVHLHVVYKPAFCGVYAAARPVVEHRWLTFLIHVDLEQLLHFQVAPVLNGKETKVQKLWYHRNSENCGATEK